MNIIITEDQNKKMNLVKFSDLVQSGTWSPNVMRHAKEGNEPYVFEDDFFVKRTDSKRKTTNKVVYLSEKGAKKMNELLLKSRELSSEAKRLLDSSKLFREIIFQQTGMEVK
jgi:hypothetical protein